MLQMEGVCRRGRGTDGLRGGGGGAREGGVQAGGARAGGGVTASGAAGSVGVNLLVHCHPVSPPRRHDLADEVRAERANREGRAWWKGVGGGGVS